MSTGTGTMHIRISARYRGRGVGREVLRQLADHHFAEDPQVQRLEGRAHENNVPMQRAFNAAGALSSQASSVVSATTAPPPEPPEELRAWSHQPRHPSSHPTHR